MLKQQTFLYSYGNINFVCVKLTKCHLIRECHAMPWHVMPLLTHTIPFHDAKCHYSHGFIQHLFFLFLFPFSSFTNCIHCSFERISLIWWCIPYHTIPYYTILCHTIPYYTILYHTILYYIMQCLYVAVIYEMTLSLYAVVVTMMSELRILGPACQ